MRRRVAGIWTSGEEVRPCTDSSHNTSEGFTFIRFIKEHDIQIKHDNMYLNFG